MRDAAFRPPRPARPSATVPPRPATMARNTALRRQSSIRAMTKAELALHRYHARCNNIDKAWWSNCVMHRSVSLDISLLVDAAVPPLVENATVRLDVGIMSSAGNATLAGTALCASTTHCTDRKDHTCSTTGNTASPALGFLRYRSMRHPLTIIQCSFHLAGLADPFAGFSDLPIADPFITYTQPSKYGSRQSASASGPAYVSSAHVCFKAPW